MVRCPRDGSFFNALDDHVLDARWEIFNASERRLLIDALDDGAIGRTIARSLLGRFAMRDIAMSRPSTEGLGAFRGVPWGATRAEVLEREGAEAAHDGGDFLMFESRLATIAVRVFYSFIDNRLARGKYVVAESYANDQSFVHAFESLRGLLIEKYGKADSDDMYWLDDGFKDSPLQLGMAAAVGQYRRFLHWQRADGDLWLGLSGENYKATVSVEYESAALGPLVAQREKDLLLRDL